MKGFIVLLSLLFSFVSLKAHKPDSVYIKHYYIQFIYKTDSLPTVKEFRFEEAMQVEIDEYPSKRQYWHGEPKNVFAYDDLDFNVNLDSLLIGNQIAEFNFFAPDRYIEIDGGKFNNGHEKKEFIRCDANNWKQYSADSLNMILLYDSYWYTRHDDIEKDPSDIKFKSVIVPLKGKRYFYNDSIYALHPDTLNGNYNELLWSRQHINDVDIFAINKRCGLYTLTGKEVIPAVYDSIKTDEVYVRAFEGESVTLFDYLGNVVKDNMKRAYPVVYRYKILDDNNDVYYMDRDGNRYDNYSYSIMSVDDILLPIPYDVVLTPPQKRGRNKKKNYHWIKFKYLWEHEDRERMKKMDSYWEREDFFQESGINTLLDNYDKETFPIFKEFYGNDFSYYQYARSMKNKLSDYDFEAYEVPGIYKQPLLVSGKTEFHGSGDYKSLPSSWIIAKYKGKYGVIDIRDTDKPILPFIYDKIEGNTTYLTLHNKGLKCYYPISDTPRYKELSPFSIREYFIRFTLPNGRKGWLLSNGEEFIDNE